MINVDLKQLFSRLNPHCRRALEDAAGVALSQGHYEISVEHVLRKLVDDDRADVCLQLAQIDIDAQALRGALDRHLSGLKSGNGGRPVFSPLLTEWVQDAWVAASIAYGQRQVRGAALLHALIERAGYYVAGTGYAGLLRKATPAGVQQAFAEIAEASSEAEALGTGAVHGAPGRAADGGTALARFCEDFTAKARAGQIDPVFGRDNEVRQVLDILGRRRKNNPICVGEPGVGKTALVEGLALKIVAGDVPVSLRNARVLGLDLTLLEAGAGVKGEYESRLRAVIDEIKASSQPVILFIDEAHMLVGSGGNAGAGDASNLLKPALARGELRTIAATTWGEYKKYFEKDAALARRFQLVKLEAPDVDGTIRILRGLKAMYEAAHGVAIRDSALVAAAELSHRYIAGRQLPDKAIDLLDTAAARVKVGLTTRPTEIERLERAMAALDQEGEALAREGRFGYAPNDARRAAIAAEHAALSAECSALTARWNAQRAAAESLLDLRSAAEAEADARGSERMAAAMQALQQAQQPTPLLFADVDADLVAKVVSDWTGVPLGRLQHDRANLAQALAQRLQARIRGQAQALESVASLLRTASTALKDPLQPLAVFLLAGPSGVGKTETAIAVAEEMFGGEHALVTVNMTEFQERHSVSRLIGSPPGYVGYGEGGVLTEAVRQRPYSVVLLDEIEKAHADVANLFYQVFDKGLLSDGEGREIDFRNTVVFLTTNLGTDIITDYCAAARASGMQPDAAEIAARLHPVLSSHFKPALLARMTVVPYVTLADTVLSEIVALKLDQVCRRAQRAAGVALRFSPAVPPAILQRCTEVDSGARNIDAIVKRQLLPRLSDALLDAQCNGVAVATFEVDIDADGAVRVAAAAPGEAAPDAAALVASEAVQVAENLP